MDVPVSPSPTLGNAPSIAGESSSTFNINSTNNTSTQQTTTKTTKSQITFYKNGISMGIAFTDIDSGSGLSPAFSIQNQSQFSLVDDCSYESILLSTKNNNKDDNKNNYNSNNNNNNSPQTRERNHHFYWYLSRVFFLSRREGSESVVQ